MRKWFNIALLTSIALWSLYVAQFRWLSILVQLVAYR